MKYLLCAESVLDAEVIEIKIKKKGHRYEIRSRLLLFLKHSWVT